MLSIKLISVITIEAFRGQIDRHLEKWPPSWIFDSHFSEIFVYCSKDSIKTYWRRFNRISKILPAKNSNFHFPIDK
jgi:hypothetical protein